VTASVVTAGIVVLDRTWEIAVHPARPIKVAAEAYRESGGGMAAAAAVTVASLGGRAAYWGRVGDDEAGDWLLRELARRNVDIAGVRRIAGAQTPSSGVLIDRRGERMLAVFRGRGLDPDPAFLPLLRLDDAGSVMVDMRWVEGAVAVLEAARARGLPRVLDADHGMQDALVRLLPLADHVVFSTLGLAEFAATSDPASGLRAASERVSGVVGVTLGEEGSCGASAGASSVFPDSAWRYRIRMGLAMSFTAPMLLRWPKGWACSRRRALPMRRRRSNARAAMAGPGCPIGRWFSTC
jgi:sulfofructose kinase